MNSEGRKPNRENGVVARQHGESDPWAEARTALGPGFYLQDIDGIAGFIGKTENRLWTEYALDDYANRYKLSRRWAWIALFDRKSSLECALKEHNRLCLSGYFQMAQKLGAGQPVPCSFWIVAGQEKLGPWTMSRLEIKDEEAVVREEQVVTLDKFGQVWERLGFVRARRQLEAWLRSSAQ